MIHDLLVEELEDLLHAEGQLLKALPKMAEAAHERRKRPLVPGEPICYIEPLQRRTARPALTSSAVVAELVDALA